MTSYLHANKIQLEIISIKNLIIYNSIEQHNIPRNIFKKAKTSTQKLRNITQGNQRLRHTQSSRNSSGL